MLLATHFFLLASCCLLPSFQLLTTCYLLLATCKLLLSLAICHLLIAASCLLHSICYFLLLATLALCCYLVLASSLLHLAYCFLLLVTCYLWIAACPTCRKPCILQYHCRAAGRLQGQFGPWGPAADVQIVVDPGSLAPRNYHGWQKLFVKNHALLSWIEKI